MHASFSAAKMQPSLLLLVVVVLHVVAVASALGSALWLASTHKREMTFAMQ